MKLISRWISPTRSIGTPSAPWTAGSVTTILELQKAYRSPTELGVFSSPYVINFEASAKSVADQHLLPFTPRQEVFFLNGLSSARISERCKIVLGRSE